MPDFLASMELKSCFSSRSYDANFLGDIIHHFVRVMTISKTVLEDFQLHV